MSKPTETIVAWINGLTAADEFTVRMAMVITNEWREQDPAWRLRIEQLRATLINAGSDESRFDDRARTMAKEMDSALRSIEAQPVDTVDR
jgi:hypothetical protein